MADQHFTPMNALEGLLLAAATGGPAEGAAFQNALLKADLYAATPKPMPLGVINVNDRFELLTVEAGGARGIALFTSLERLVDSFPSSGYVEAKGEKMLQLVREQGVILNFRQPHAVAWTPDAIRRVLEAGKPRLV